MKGFVINLDRRQDRYQEFMENFKDTGIEITRVPAVDSRDIEFETPKGLVLKNRVCDWNFNHLPINKIKNVVACCLSHQKVWKMISKMTSEKAVYVFEDDCKIVLDNLKNITIPNDFCIIWLNKNVKNTLINKTFSVIPHSSSDYTTESYIVTPKFARGMLNWMTNYLGSVDAHMDQYIKKTELKLLVAYEANPPIFCQSGSKSDIQ